MALKKNPRIDLKLKYQRIFEVSLILSLLLLTLAFKYFPNIEKQKVLIEQAQPLVNVLDVAITRQETRPPAPPRPPIPIEAPTDNLLDDIEIGRTDIDINQPVAPPLPPRPKEVERKVEAEDNFFIVVEEMPEPVGGIQTLHNRIVYPDIAVKAGIEGLVTIMAYVNESGTVVKTEVIKGIGGGCDEAAETAVKATLFNPGKQRGKPVKVKVSVPIRFKLQQ